MRKYSIQYWINGLCYNYTSCLQFPSTRVAVLWFLIYGMPKIVTEDSIVCVFNPHPTLITGTKK